MLKKNQWVKSSRSGHNSACVEAMDSGSAVGIRDSKYGRAEGFPAVSPVFSLAPADFRGLIATVKSGA